MRASIGAFGVLAVLGAPIAAEETPDVEAFVEGNVLSIFYHELGHALIHIEEVPIFAQEEDAADVFAVILAEAAWAQETALDLAYDFALLFEDDAIVRAENGEGPSWWSTHGPDEQRFYNTVCLFYGADPDKRIDYAVDMGLPEERADFCPEEFDQARAAWGGVLDVAMERGPGDTLRLQPDPPGRIGAVLTEEVTALNEMLQLAAPLDIRVENCGEANAFYDPGERTVIFCTEYETSLIESGRRIYE
ncbi:DUF4344 domain-containing metallopeptidase [Jannaschia marina]|uniref:DUF4344 domain-containing metallopeptidase n=1 Tax=Jannaschia marina TaxID=2741674 RepID=UPI0015C96475|nr:DUF4344 domain-containing metallopeptidase [Jannaschia marina]